MFKGIKRWIVRSILGKDTCDEIINALHYSKYKYVRRGNAERASDVEVAIRNSIGILIAPELVEYVGWKHNGERQGFASYEEVYELGKREGYSRGCHETAENIRENFEHWSTMFGIVRCEESDDDNNEGEEKEEDKPQDSNKERESVEDNSPSENDGKSAEAKTDKDNKEA